MTERHQRLVRGPAMTLLGIIVSLFQTALVYSAPALGAELPKPTGPNAVGTTSWVLIDRSRPETFGPRGAWRQVQVVAWYPAAEGSSRATAPYLRAGIAEGSSLGTLTGKPGDFADLATIRTEARLDADIASSPSKLKVLVFSHGYLAVRSSYTALLEDLASHGYVVLSVIHPYEASAATMAGGETVTFLDENNALRQGIRAVLEEWGDEDEAMKAVTAAAEQKDQLRLLRRYLSGLRETGDALRRWVQDLKLALDQLPSFSRGTLTRRLAGRADMTQVGVFGHSMGGVSSGQFCLEDSRCQAALNLDGIPQYGGMIDRRLHRPFLMVYSGRPGRLGASDAIYTKSAASYYRVDVQDTLHLDFSDMPFWTAAGLRERNAFGAMSPTRAAMMTRTIVREYFDQVLLRRPSPLLSRKAILSEVVVHPVVRSR